ncbi:hypothetical protein F5884DRAFT_874136, partial [Xylogone sp. PMI_703]
SQARRGVRLEPRERRCDWSEKNDECVFYAERGGGTFAAPEGKPSVYPTMFCMETLARINTIQFYIPTSEAPNAPGPRHLDLARPYRYLAQQRTLRVDYLSIVSQLLPIFTHVLAHLSALNWIVLDCARRTRHMFDTQPVHPALVTDLLTASSARITGKRERASSLARARRSRKEGRTWRKWERYISRRLPIRHGGGAICRQATSGLAPPDDVQTTCSEWVGTRAGPLIGGNRNSESGLARARRGLSSSALIGSARRAAKLRSRRQNYGFLFL